MFLWTGQFKSCVLRGRNSVCITDRKPSQKWLGVFLAGVGEGVGLMVPFRKMFGPHFDFLHVNIKVFYKTNQLYSIISYIGSWSTEGNGAFLKHDGNLVGELQRETPFMDSHFCAPSTEMCCLPVLSRYTRHLQSCIFSPDILFGWNWAMKIRSKLRTVNIP